MFTRVMYTTLFVRDQGQQMNRRLQAVGTTPQRLAVDGFWLWSIESHKVFNLRTKFLLLHTLGQIPRDRRKNIASVEGVADGLQEIMLASDVANVYAFFPGIH